MNRYAYLNALSNCIQNELPADEYNNVMQYYTEYFADAGVEKEQEVIAELGAPNELAGKIIGEYRGKQPSDVVIEKKKKGLPVGWFIFIAIIGSPLWFGLLCAAIGIAAAIVAVIVSIIAASVALMLSGVTVVIGGIVAAFSNGANGAMVAGIGCLSVGVGILFAMLSVLIVSSIVKLCKWASAKKKNKKSGSNTAAQNAE